MSRSRRPVGLERAVVKWFNRLRGFGFLTRGEGTPDIFVHMEDAAALRHRGAPARPDRAGAVSGPVPKGMMAAEVRPDTGSSGTARPHTDSRLNWTSIAPARARWFDFDGPGRRWASRDTKTVVRSGEMFVRPSKKKFGGLPTGNNRQKRLDPAGFCCVLSAGPPMEGAPRSTICPPFRPGVPDAHSACRNFAVALVLAAGGLFSSFGGFQAIKAAAQEAGLLEKRESLYNNIFIFGDRDQRHHDVRPEQALLHREQHEAVRPRRADGRLHPPDDARRRLSGEGRAHRRDRARRRADGVATSARRCRTPASSPIELDKDVVDLAKKYFKFQETARLRTVVSDGRAYLLKDPEKWDVILIDAYRGPFVPFHLLTKEFYTLVKSRLNPGGVVVQNIEPSTMLFDSRDRDAEERVSLGRPL